MKIVFSYLLLLFSTIIGKSAQSCIELSVSRSARSDVVDSPPTDNWHGRGPRCQSPIWLLLRVQVRLGERRGHHHVFQGARQLHQHLHAGYQPHHRGLYCLCVRNILSEFQFLHVRQGGGWTQWRVPLQKRHKDHWVIGPVRNCNQRSAESCWQSFPNQRQDSLLSAGSQWDPTPRLPPLSQDLESELLCGFSQTIIQMNSIYVRDYTVICT